MSLFDSQFERYATPLIHQHFGDSLVYTAVTGAQRIGLAVVEEFGAFRDADTGIMSAEQMLVTVQRRETDHPDALYIDNPQIGDSIYREGSDMIYAYSGEKTHVTTDSWQLIFSRKFNQLTGQVGKL